MKDNTRLYALTVSGHVISGKVQHCDDQGADLTDAIVDGGEGDLPQQPGIAKLFIDAHHVIAAWCEAQRV